MKVSTCVFVAVISLFSFHQNVAANIFANTFVDLALEALHSDFFLTGRDSVPLPDFKVSYDEVVLLFIHVPGNLTATRGKLSHLSALKRVGDVTYTKDADSKTFEFVLNPSQLELSYHYVVRRGQGKVALPGTIKASVPTKFRVKAGIKDTKDEKCTVGIESFEMDDVTNINVQATGFATKPFLFPKASAKVTSILKQKIVELRSQLSTGATKSVRVPCFLNELLLKL